MDNNNGSKKLSHACFQVNDLYEQAEELRLLLNIPAQGTLTLNGQGLGLCLSSGMQEPKKSCCMKLTPKVVKHTSGSLSQNKFKRILAINTKKKYKMEEDAGMSENKEPRIQTKKSFPRLSLLIC
jgi:hypothetical protein